MMEKNYQIIQEATIYFYMSHRIVFVSWHELNKAREVNDLWITINKLLYRFS